MKRLILILTCALFAASCNPGVFIKPLEIEFSGTEFDLPFYGGSVTIDVSHGDWEVQNVTFNYIDVGWRDDVMRYWSNFTSFGITRPLPTRLVLTLDECVKTEPSLIQIFIGNEYESEVVSINVSACAGYSFAEIEYEEPVLLVADGYEEVWCESVTNGLDVPMAWECPVFDERFARTLWFPASTVMISDVPYVMWYDTLMEFVGEPFDVPVPDPLLSDGALSFSGEMVEFSYDEVVLPLVFEQETASVSLAPGSNAVRMFWGYEEYEVGYTIWFTHSGGGRDLCFSGKFTSKAYNGRWRVEL